MNLKGTTTTISGIISIIMGALGLFSQVMGVVNGGTLDPTMTAGSMGAISAGAGLVKAADQKQPDTGQPPLQPNQPNTQPK